MQRVLLLSLCLLAALWTLAGDDLAQAARRKKEPPPLTYPRVEWRQTQYDDGKLQNEWQVLLKSADESVRQGIFRRYHENGRLSLLGAYRNNEPVGIWTWLDDRGNVLRQTRQSTDYDDEIVGEETRSPVSVYRYPSGLPSAEGRMKADVPHGHWVFYFSNGTPKAEGDFLTGASDGQWNYYHPNGQIEHQMRYVLGVPNGPYRSSYANGQEQEVGQYDQGVRTGQWRTWYEDGQLHEEGLYAEDRREGDWREWATDGHLVRHTLYRDGVLAADLPVPQFATAKEPVIPHDDQQRTTPPPMFDENGNTIQPYDDEFVPPPPRGKRATKPPPLSTWRNADQAGQ